jgi:hypothetical protein
MASENGHIYTHGAAPTLGGAGVASLGYEVTSQAASVTSGSTSVTLSAANGLIVVGQTVAGTDIPDGTTVVAVSGTSLTLSQAATGTNASEALGFATPTTNNDTNGFIAFVQPGAAVLSFNKPYTSIPACQVSVTSGTVTVVPDTTTFKSLTIATGGSSGTRTITYHCEGTN